MNLIRFKVGKPKCDFPVYYMVDLLILSELAAVRVHFFEFAPSGRKRLPTALGFE